MYIHRRRALTLVELLIVIAIMTLLTAIVLPMFKTVLKDRKTNQAAIMVRSMIEEARTTAMATGRPVALVLERANSSYVFSPPGAGVEDAFAINAVTKISLAEVLKPYTGDLPSSSARITGTNTALIEIEFQNPNAIFFVAKGNQISFGEWTNRFEITSDPILLVEDPPPTDRNPMKWLEFTFNNGTPGTAGTNEPYASVAPMTTGNRSFKIFSRPRRLFDRSIDLPRGTCVDLSLSGIGNRTFDAATGTTELSIPSPRPANIDTLRRQNLVHSPGIQFASDEVNLDINAVMTLDQFKAVFLEFNSRGELSAVWQNGPESARMQRISPRASVYLMVGRTDLVPIANSDLTLSYRFDEPTGEQRGSNLYDGSNYWVRISSGNGQVALGTNGDPRTADPFPADANIPTYGAILQHCRKSVMYGFDLTGP